MADEIVPILEPQEDHYFPSNNNFMRFLRFINVLEPGRASLSVSKLFLWVTVALFVITAIITPENAIAMIATVSAVMGSGANYAYRRKIQTSVTEVRRGR